MGYSKKSSVIKRVKPILDALLLAIGKEEERQFTWQSAEPHKLAYWVREALFAASSLSDSPYSKLREEFVVRQRRDHILIEPRVKIASVMAKETLSKIVLPDIANVEQAVGAAIVHKSASELYFPYLLPTEEELFKLYKWCTETKWDIINGGEAGVTLLKSAPSELTWKPKGQLNETPT